MVILVLRWSYDNYVEVIGVCSMMLNLSWWSFKCCYLLLYKCKYIINGITLRKFAIICFLYLLVKIIKFSFLFENKCFLYCEVDEKFFFLECVLNASKLKLKNKWRGRLMSEKIKEFTGLNEMSRIEVIRNITSVSIWISQTFRIITSIIFHNFDVLKLCAACQKVWLVRFGGTYNRNELYGNDVCDRRQSFWTFFLYKTRGRREKKV